MNLSIDRYKVKRLIGQGSMGRIYLATDPRVGRDVAIKVLTSHTDDSNVRRRFRLEARAIAALKHPNIVELYDYSGEEADDLFLVMEYIPGRTLQEYVAERGPMQEPTALCVGHELGLALEHSHSHMVVHRDLKPENVLLHQGRVVLTDFGVVKQIAAGGALGQSNVRPHTVIVGTPGYMAWEQLIGRGVEPGTDLFALGAVLFNLVTGELPFPGTSIDEVADRVRRGKHEDPRVYAPMLSDGFCSLIERCLKSKARLRFKTADELRRNVLELLGVHGVSEIRSELLSYENNPTTHANEQHERRLEVLMRDLKVAVKDHDDTQVQDIIRQIQTISPVEDRFKDMTGLIWDKNSRPVVVQGRRKVRSRMWLGATVGLGAGVMLGALATLQLLAAGAIPTGLLAWFEQLADRLGFGY